MIPLAFFIVSAREDSSFLSVCLVGEADRCATHVAVGLDRGRPLEGERQFLGACVADRDVSAVIVLRDCEIDGGVLGGFDAVGLEATEERPKAGLARHHEEARGLGLVRRAAKCFEFVRNDGDVALELWGFVREKALAAREVEPEARRF